MSKLNTAKCVYYTQGVLLTVGQTLPNESRCNFKVVKFDFLPFMF